MPDLTEFLLARIEEDQVKRVTMREWHAEDCDTIPQLGAEYTYPCDCGVPERMGRECEAKRRIVARHRPTWLDGCSVCGPDTGRSTFDQVCSTLALLALPYSDHPDYDEKWAN